MPAPPGDVHCWLISRPVAAHPPTRARHSGPQRQADRSLGDQAPTQRPSQAATSSCSSRVSNPTTRCSHCLVRPRWTAGDQAHSHLPPLGGTPPAAALSECASTGAWVLSFDECLHKTRLANGSLWFVLWSIKQKQKRRPYNLSLSPFHDIGKVLRAPYEVTHGIYHYSVPGSQDFL